MDETGVKTPEEASRWRELLKYLVDSYDLHRTAGRWVANGYTPDSAEIWLKAKYKSADAVAALEKAGFSPGSFDQEWAYRLPNLTDDEVLKSIPWLKAGKTFDEAKLFVAPTIARGGKRMLNNLSPEQTTFIQGCTC